MKLCALLTYLFFILYSKVDVSCLVKIVHYQPEQIHLSYSDTLTDMVVTWTTLSEIKANNSFSHFGQIGSHNAYKSVALIEPFVNLGKFENRTTWIHKAVMTNLMPGKTYWYRVGGLLGWSESFFFKAKNKDANWSPNLIIYGDFGNYNGRSTSFLQSEAQSGLYDAFFHIGDLAYNLYEDVGRMGDAFMNQIQPIAAYLPYMTAPGNHESYYNFSHYKNRFNMPGSYNSMMYSMTIGPARIIMFNSEVFYTKEYLSFDSMLTQYYWLEEELKKANEPKNRAIHPWIIVGAHRPMYCSNDDGGKDMCNDKGLNPVREGIDRKTRAYSLEDLFCKYGVDLQFYAHQHWYERMWPVYKEKVMNGSKKAYHNAKAPVHIVTGSPGNREGQTKFVKVFNFSAFRTSDYGYTRLKICNSSALHVEQISIDMGKKVIDDFYITKDNPLNPEFNCF